MGRLLPLMIDCLNFRFGRRPVLGHSGRWRLLSWMTGIALVADIAATQYTWMTYSSAAFNSTVPI